MFDQILDNFRKATECTMQFQQEMLRQWTQQLGQIPGVRGVPTAPPTAKPSAEPAQAKQAPGAPAVPFSTLSSEQVQAIQKQWTSSITDLLRKHSEALDALYAAGIKTIEDAFRVGEAKDPEQFRRLTENLWRQSFDSLKTVAEDQLREIQAAAPKWLESLSMAVGAPRA